LWCLGTRGLIGVSLAVDGGHSGEGGSYIVNTSTKIMYLGGVAIKTYIITLPSFVATIHRQP